MNLTCFPLPTAIAICVSGIVTVCAGTFAASLPANMEREQSSPQKSIVYQNDRVASVPWSVHIVKIARSDSTLELRSTLAQETVLGLSRMSEQALAIPAQAGTPLAAVNGDFYERENSRYAGDPRGLQIVEGDLVSAPASQPGYCAFWIDAEGNPHGSDVTSKFHVVLPDGRRVSFELNEERLAKSAVLFTPTLGRSTKTIGGRELILEKFEEGPWLPLKVGETFNARVREVRETGNTSLTKEILVLSLGPRLATNLPSIPPGTLLKISTATDPDLRGARTAIGGGSIITREGKGARIERPEPGGSLNSYTVNSMFERHPRSAVGWSKTHLYLVTVDGRQRSVSVGMTLAELGRYMARLGCEEAINLDGGGSATFWYRGRVVNSPCDGTERTVANGLMVLRRAKSP